jgi:hypothetical protein
MSWPFGTFIVCIKHGEEIGDAAHTEARPSSNTSLIEAKNYAGADPAQPHIVFGDLRAPWARAIWLGVAPHSFA